MIKAYKTLQHLIVNLIYFLQLKPFSQYFLASVSRKSLFFITKQKYGITLKVADSDNSAVSCENALRTKRGVPLYHFNKRQKILSR